MNKMLTGAIAISASALLLVGGGGTLAIWNVSESTAPGTITSGKIGLDPQGAGWYNVTSGIEVPIDIATYLIIPGETLRYRQSMDVIVKGTNAAADLTVTGGFTNHFDPNAVQLSGKLTAEGASSAVYSFSAWSADQERDLNETVTQLQQNVNLTAEVDFTFVKRAVASTEVNFEFDPIKFELIQVPKIEDAVPTLAP